MGEMTGRFAVIVTAVTGVIIYLTTGQKRQMGQNSLTNTMGEQEHEREKESPEKKENESWEKLGEMCQ